MFHGAEQIGFQCFANYVPWRKGNTKKKMHMNRIVIHPDYVGFGLGLTLINITSEHMAALGFDVWAKFSSLPIYKSFERYKDKWELLSIDRTLKRAITGNILRDTGYREKVRTFSYRYIGPGHDVETIARGTAQQMVEEQKARAAL